MNEITDAALSSWMEVHSNEMWFHFKEILKINTVRCPPTGSYPYGAGCAEALDYILQLSREFGLTTVNMDYHVGYSEYGHGEDYVCCVAHLDVVPAGEGWSFPPFAAIEDEQYLYARGCADDKPGCIAGLYALRCFKELGYIPNRKIRVIYGCAEEIGSPDIEYYLSREPLPLFGITPDGDQYDVYNAEKGRIEFSLTSKSALPLQVLCGGMSVNTVPSKIVIRLEKESLTPVQREVLYNMLAETEQYTSVDDGLICDITFHGIATHAAFPEKAVSAISVYAKFVKQLFHCVDDPITYFLADIVGDDFYGRNMGIAFDSEEMGRLTISFGLLRIENTETVIVGDIRYPAQLSSNAIIETLTSLVRPLKIELTINTISEGYLLTEHPAFEVIKRVCRDKKGKAPDFRYLAGGTYARKFGGRLVTFGGCGENVHAVNERVHLYDFLHHMDMISYSLYCLSKDL